MWLFSCIAEVIQTFLYEAVPIPLYGGICLHTTSSNIVSWLIIMMLSFKEDDAHLKVCNRPFW